MCALLGRSEIKDIVDLFYLEQAGFKIEEHIEDAKRKDGGFDPAAVSYILSTIEIQSMPLHLVRPLEISELQSFVDTLRKRMADLSYPEK
jgi:hypothetical protein